MTWLNSKSLGQSSHYYRWSNLRRALFLVVNSVPWITDIALPMNGRLLAAWKKKDQYNGQSWVVRTMSQDRYYPCMRVFALLYTHGPFFALSHTLHCLTKVSGAGVNGGWCASSFHIKRAMALFARRDEGDGCHCRERGRVRRDAMHEARPVTPIYTCCYIFPRVLEYSLSIILLAEPASIVIFTTAIPPGGHRI